MVWFCSASQSPSFSADAVQIPPNQLLATGDPNNVNMKYEDDDEDEEKEKEQEEMRMRMRSIVSEWLSSATQGRQSIGNGERGNP